MKINYYDNTAKNIFVMLSIFALLFCGALQDVTSYLSYFEYGDYEFNVMSLITKYIINIPSFWFNIIPSILLLIFAILIFKDYGFKKWILPIFFITKAISVFWALMQSVINIVGLFIKGTLTATDNLSIYKSMFVSIVTIVALIIMFIGSINNFKLATLFKVGALIMVGYNAFTFGELSNTLIASFINYSSYPSFGSTAIFRLSSFISVLVLISNILFFISLYLLVKRKKPIVEITE